jgi:hypothetical protein
VKSAGGGAAESLTVLLKLVLCAIGRRREDFSGEDDEEPIPSVLAGGKRYMARGSSLGFSFRPAIRSNLAVCFGFLIAADVCKPEQVGGALSAISQPASVAPSASAGVLAKGTASLIVRAIGCRACLDRNSTLNNVTPAV